MRGIKSALGSLYDNVAPWKGFTKESGENRFEYEAADTTVTLHGYGLGDLMIIRQFGRALQGYFADHGDPELGEIVIATGGHHAAYHPDDGDVNLYWWWSFGGHDDEPDGYLKQYVEEAAVEPDVILCPSDRCLNEAQQLGYETLYLPLGTQAFEPLGFRRSGLGYAGSKGHKRPEKQQRLFGPYYDSDDLEWVSHFVYPEQLNSWYNTKQVTFGLHKEGQRQWGMVNNRVFETLASGTPFVLETHPVVDDVLGFEYPYQSSSPEETRELVERIRANPDEVAAEFESYAHHVREEHSYDQRVRTLIDHLS